MRVIALIGLVALMGCNDRRPAPTSEPYVIRNDGGGQLISAEADRARLLAWGGRVVIFGKCASACVMFTTLPNACIGPNARIGFHGSNVNMGPIGNQQMAKYMRGDVRRKFESEWQFIPPDQIHWVSARDYVKLDPDVRLCGMG